MAKKAIKSLPHKFKRWVTKYNDSVFDKDYQEIIAHVHYAANSGKYVWEEPCAGWDRGSKITYMLIKLEEEGFNCYHSTNNTIHIEWS